jgi:trehalose/maltose hydrolase-like predicted phosphorylase
MMTSSSVKSRIASAAKLTKGILKKQRQSHHKVINKKPVKTPEDVTTLIEKISTLTVQEELAKNDDLKIELVFFLSETYEKNYSSLCKEIKSSFVSPFDLNKIEIFSSNHQRILIGRVYHHCKGKSPLSHSKSPLFTTEIDGKLYSREL